MNLISLLTAILKLLERLLRASEEKKAKELEDETISNPRDVFKREFMRSNSSDKVSEDSETKS